MSWAVAGILSSMILWVLGGIISAFQSESLADLILRTIVTIIGPALLLPALLVHSQ